MLLACSVCQIAARTLLSSGNESTRSYTVPCCNMLCMHIMNIIESMNYYRVSLCVRVRVCPCPCLSVCTYTVTTAKEVDVLDRHLGKKLQHP